MRRRNRSAGSYVLVAVIAVLVTALAAGTAWYFMDSTHQKELSEVEIRLHEINEALAAANEEKEALLAEKNALEQNLTEAREAIASAEKSDSAAEIALKEAQEALAEAEARISQQQARIDELSDEIKKLTEMFSLDDEKRNELVDELNALLTEGRPRVTEKIPMVDENGEPVLDEEGKQLYTVEKRPCQVSIYYEDLETGLVFAHGADVKYPSASLVKAPFALSFMRVIRDEWLVLAENAEEGAELDPMDVMGLSDVFTYTVDYRVGGSGVIFESPEGTEYRYYELVAYLLNESDNVAYSRLRAKYGTKYLSEMIKELELTSMYGGIHQMSARDCGTVMKELYAFIEEENPYSSLLYDNLVQTNYQVMIPYGVHPTPAPHKYGWDVGAYHDMAVVYDEHPYVVAILTDLDEGDYEVRTYVQTVIGKINELHKSMHE